MMRGSSKAEKLRTTSASKAETGSASISFSSVRIFSRCSLIFRRTSHKLASLERGHICRVKIKPFTVPTLRLKPAVPVGFDAYRVICANDVDCLQFFRKLNRNLVLSSARCVASSKLVEFPRLHQIDVAKDCLTVIILSVGLGAVSDSSTQDNHIFVS